MIKNARKYVVSVVGSVALVALSASTTSAEPAEKTEVPSVSLTGSARMHYAPSPQDRVHVSFDAHATYPEWGQDQQYRAGPTSRTRSRIACKVLDLGAAPRKTPPLLPPTQSRMASTKLSTLIC